MMPKGWSHNRLDSVCSKITDGAHHSPKSVDIGYPMYSVKDMSYSGFYENTARLIDEVDYLSLVNQNCKPLINDILIAKDGSILKHCFVVKENVEGVILSSIALLRPKLEKIYPEYIAQYFSQEWVKSFVVRALTSGSGVPRIILKDFKSIKIPLPPLPEQQKIAKILSTWDKAISTTECLIDNSTQQKKALMQQLLTGKKRLLDESGKRFEGEWKEVKLGDLKLDISDGNYSAKYPKQADFLDTGVPFLRANNLDKGTISDTDMRFISPKQHSEITKGHLKKGDILLSTRGELGNVALVPDRHIGSNINAQLVRINTKDKLSGKFLFQLFDYLRVTGKFESLSTGTALKQLPIGKLKILEFNLPLLIEEQQKIATVLTNADKEIDLLEQQLADFQQEKKALMQVLLTGKKRVTLND